MKRFTGGRLMAIAVVVLIALLSVPISPAQAKQGGGLSVPITGTGTGGTFVGSVDIQGSQREAGSSWPSVLSPER